MPITTKYDGEFIVTRMSGCISLPDLLAYASEVAAIEIRLPVTPHRLAHLTSGTVGDVNFIDLHTFATTRQAVPPRNPVKSAIIAGDAVQYGFARMFQTLSEHPDIRVEIFQSEAPALAWLRE